VQEKKVVELLTELIKEQVPPTAKVLEYAEGLREVQLSIADRIDVIEGWVESATNILRQHGAGKVELKKLERLQELVRDGMVSLIYSAHMLTKQRLEILSLQQRLKQQKKGTST
jgi:hypothetical protein